MFEALTRIFSKPETEVPEHEPQLAVAALAPERAFDVAQADGVSPALHAFMDKVRVTPDEALTDGFPALWRARLRVHAAGTWLEHQIAQIPGDPGRPFTEADVIDKFHRFADDAVGADRVDELCAGTAAVLAGRSVPAQLLGAIASALT